MRNYFVSVSNRKDNKASLTENNDSSVKFHKDLGIIFSREDDKLANVFQFSCLRLSFSKIFQAILHLLQFFKKHFCFLILKKFFN